METEREKKREREREIVREKERERHRERKTEREREREREREECCQIEKNKIRKNRVKLIFCLNEEKMKNHENKTFL